MKARKSGEQINAASVQSAMADPNEANDTATTGVKKGKVPKGKGGNGKDCSKGQVESGSVSQGLLVEQKMRKG